MTKDEIIEYASRYIEPEDVSDFPEEGDLFVFIHRELPDNAILKDEEGWQFGGYAKLIQYELDMNAKPLGKWITVHYLSLAVFPPRKAQLQLQPPHIARGTFQSPDRTSETKIVLIREPSYEDTSSSKDDMEPTIMQFPQRS